MRAVCDLAPLRAGLRYVAAAVEARITIPVLAHIRIEAGPSGLTLMATDMDLTLEVDVAAEVLREGVTLAPSVALAEFLAAAPGGRIEINADARGIELSSGRARVTLRTMDIADFPTPRTAGPEPVAVEAETFSVGLRFVLPAVSREETRWYLCGTWIEESEEGHVHLWATDGHRLHHASLPSLPRVGGGGILPAKAIAAVLAIIDGAETPRFAIDGQGWRADSGSRRGRGRVIDGVFPDPRRVMPGSSRQLVALADKGALSRAVAVARVGQDGRTRALVLTAIEGGPLLVRGVQGADAKASATEADAGGEARLDFGLGINGAYLTDTLAVMPDGNVALEWISAQDPIRLAPAQASVTLPLEAVIMGMRADVSLFASAAEAAEAAA